MKTRRHHNNKGYRQIKNGKTSKTAAIIAHKLNIPFKRENWKMELGSKEDLQTTKKINKKLQSVFFDRYKTMFWFKKEYK
jgi:hypothetical protein